MSAFLGQVDIKLEEMGNNLIPAVALPGDIKAVATQVCFIYFI